MKKLLIGLLAVGTFSSFAGEVGNGATLIPKSNDMAELKIVAGTQADCNKKLKNTLDELKSLNKFVIAATQCHSEGKYPYESEIQVFKY
jgi:hypothetical protein